MNGVAGRLVSTSASRLLVLACGVAVSVLVSRGLEPEARGYYGVLAALAVLTTSLGGLSMEQSLGLNYARDPGSGTAAASIATYVGLVWGSLVALLTVGLVLAGVDIGVPRAPLSGLVWTGVGIVLAITTLWSQRVMLLRGRVRAFNVGSVVAAVWSVAADAVLFATGTMTAPNAVAVLAGNSLVTVVVAVVVLRPRWRDLTWRSTRGSFRDGLAFHPARVALVLLLRLDVLILSSLAGPFAVGIYTVAVSVAEPINQMTSSLTGVFTDKQYAADRTAAVRATAALSRFNLLFAGTVGIVGAGCAWAVIPFVYGRAFAGASTVFLFIVPGVVALACGRAIGNFFIREKRALLMTTRAVLAVVIDVVLCLILIPRWGASGAAAASSAAYVVYAAVTYGSFLRLTDVRPVDLLPRRADLATVRWRRTPRPART